MKLRTIFLKKITTYFYIILQHTFKHQNLYLTQNLDTVTFSQRKPRIMFSPASINLYLRKFTDREGSCVSAYTYKILKAFWRAVQEINENSAKKCLQNFLPSAMSWYLALPDHHLFLFSLLTSSYLSLATDNNLQERFVLIHLIVWDCFSACLLIEALRVL